MEKKEYKSIIIWTLLGFICVLMIRNIEELLGSIFKIIGIVSNVKPEYYLFIQVIPEVLIILFWIYLIFIYLKKADPKTIIDKFPIEFAKTVAIITLIVFLALLSSRFFEEYLWSNHIAFRVNPAASLVKIKVYLMSGLNLIEVILITIGFLRIIKE
jgi:hypothetical protein